MAEITSVETERADDEVSNDSPWLMETGRIEVGLPIVEQLSFEDDFSPIETVDDVTSTSPTSSTKKTEFVRMPDSSKYLSTLEAKLAQLKGSKCCKDSSNENSRKLLDDLMAVKEGHMSRFMASTSSVSTSSQASTTDQNYAGDQELALQFESSSGSLIDPDLQQGPMDFIRARICPEKQALTADELLALIASDFLNNSAGTTTSIVDQATDRTEDDVQAMSDDLIVTTNTTSRDRSHKTQ